MTRKTITSHDVARAAGVSRATVSIVLNRSKAVVIGEETRRRVETVAAELGYRPNSAARMLRSGATETIGLLVTESKSLPVDAYIPLLYDGIGGVLRDRGYRLLLETLNPVRGKNPYTDLVESRRIDGLLMLSPRVDDRDLVELIEIDYPIVLFGSVGHPKELSVSISTKAGIADAVAHVVGFGHRRIGSIPFSQSGFAATDIRLKELRRAMAAQGLVLDDDAVVHGDFSAASGHVATLSLMAARPDLTAIFAGNDTIALGVIGALATLGLSVPADVSVVGFDDLPFAAYIAPPLTTVRMDAELQGRRAAEMLMLRLLGDPVTEPKIAFTSQFVARASCAPPRDRHSKVG